MASSATIANLDVNLRANTVKYNNNLKGSTQSTRTFTQATATAGTESERFTGFINKSTIKLAAYSAGFLAVGKAVSKVGGDFTKTGDDIDKMSSRLQISTDDVQTLTFAIEQNGGSAGDLETAIRKMSKSYLDFIAGSPKAVGIFRDLRINLQDLQSLSVDNQFRLIVSRLREINDLTKKNAISQELFGRSGNTFLPLVNTLGQYEQRLIDLGLVIEESAIKQSARLADVNNELDRSYKKLMSEIGSNGSPIIEGWNMIWRDTNRLVAKSIKGYRLLGQELGVVRRNANAINIPENLDQRFSGVGSRSGSPIVKRRLTVRDPLSDSGSSTIIEKQINAQKEIIRTLQNQNNTLAPIPQALQKGTSAQIGFITNLKRQNDQARINAREKKKLDLAKKQLKELEKLNKAQKESDKKEGISIL